MAAVRGAPSRRGSAAGTNPYADAGPAGNASSMAAQLLGAGAVGWGTLAVQSGKAITLNVANPLALLVQTAVLGAVDYTDLSAYTLVSAATTLASVVFNFLTDGVTAKVSRSVGAKDWAGAALYAFYSYLFALVLGGACCGVILLLFSPVMLAAGASAEVRSRAVWFYIIRSVQVPVVQVTMANTGILSGFQKLGTAAALNMARALLDIAGTFVAILVLKGGLVALGIAGIAAYGLCALAGIYLVLTAVPDGAPEGFSLLHPGGAAAGDGLEAPLLSPEGTAEAGEREEGAEEVDRWTSSRFWEFFYDSFDMVVRSVALQASFFAGAVFASRLPHSTEALAAHGIVVQLWMLTAYITDGFANVGTMFGGKFYGSGRLIDKLLFQRLTERLVLCGLLVGAAFAIVMLLAEEEIIHVFTLKKSASRPLVVKYLHQVWPMLAVMQPVNSLVFVYDGLVYAAQRFYYVRNLMLSGLALVFVPVLSIGWSLHPSLYAIWLAKSVMNGWRLWGLAAEVHLRVLGDGGAAALALYRAPAGQGAFV